MARVDSKNKALVVSTSSHQYSIFIDQQINLSTCLKPVISGKHLLIITDKNVADLYLDQVTNELSHYQINTFIIEPGEESKNSQVLFDIFRKMIASQLNRDVTVLAFGGGVVGDIAGFAASCYQRGVSFIQLPTTLLAQVDSSVGGKTAINFESEKNVLGSFYQPQAVFIDLNFLKTLPEREYRAGLAEVVKYGLIQDKRFYDWIINNISDILDRKPDALTFLIRRCCEIKAKIVSLDEKEQGARALLNLGHTFGHALEAVTLYKMWLHGEAVAIGLHCQARLALVLGFLTQRELNQLVELLKRMELPYQIPAEIDLEKVLQLMFRDKKTRDSHLRLIINHAIGKAEIYATTDLSLIKGVLENVSC